MSLQVCHCGWSKVTTYQGLRTHQGKMGCTVRGVRVEQSEQQYMWGNAGYPNNQKDFGLDAYICIKAGGFLHKFLITCCVYFSHFHKQHDTLINNARLVE